MDEIHEDCPLPEGLSRPAVRALNGVVFTTLSQFSNATESELKALHGMASNAMTKIREALSRARLKLMT